MKIRTAFQQGFLKVFSYYKIIGVVFIINLFAALIVALPFASSLDKVTAQNPNREDLVQFDYAWWQEIHFNADGLLQTLRPSLSSGIGTLFDNLELLLTGHFGEIGWQLFTLAIVYLLVTAFLNGGIISLYLDEKRKFTLQRFFSYCGQHVNHMSAIAFTAVLVFLAFYKLLHPALFSIPEQLSYSTLDSTVVWFSTLCIFLLLFFLMIFLDIIFDYSKIIVIHEKKDSSWLSIWLAIKFFFKNFTGVIGLYLNVLILSAIVMTLGGFLLSLISANSAGVIIVTIILQQILILVQIIFRLSFYSTAVSLYTGRTMQKKIKKIKR